MFILEYDYCIGSREPERFETAGAAAGAAWDVSDGRVASPDREGRSWLASVAEVEAELRLGRRVELDLTVPGCRPSAGCLQSAD
jgi:hypothetical protein